MIARRVLLLALVSIVAAAPAARADFVENESRKLAETISELEQTFEGTMRQIFWLYKGQAELLVQKGHELEGKELLSVAQTAAFIESVKYAIRHKSLSVVRETIGQRFAEDGIVLLDRKLNVNIRPGMLSVLASRVVLRSLLDCDRFTAPYWGLLHGLVEHNSRAYPANKSFKKLAVAAYQQLLKLNIDTQRARQEFERILASSLTSMDIDPHQGKHIVALVDQMIEDMLECRGCSSAPAEQYESANIRPMFDGEPAIERAVAEHVSAQIQEAFVEIQGVFDVSVEQQARVTRADIERLMQELMEDL